MNEKRVAITGAAGQIAYQLIFSLLKGEVFGDDGIHLHLVDIDIAQPRLQGVIMEIEDGAFSRLRSVSAFSDTQLDKGFANIDFAFLVGASPRKAGMERSDLLAQNGAIFKKQGQALSQYANSGVNVLVVGNPCNTNCLIAMHNAENIDNKQFFAMTMLDEHRARYQLAKRANVDVSAVSGVYIYGNHSATQYPDFENTNVELDLDDTWWHESFVPMIQTRGAKVIEARGASSAASAAHAAIVTAHHIVTQSSTPFSVACYASGAYGSPKGLIVSLPHYFHNGDIVPYTEYTHSDKAVAWIQASYDELMAEYEQIKSMGLIDVG